MSNRGRRRAPQGSRTVRRRVISVGLCGVSVAGLATGCWAEPSAMPAVRDFLIAWQVGNYQSAAGKTIGADRKAVASALGQVRAQLDAASMRLALGTPGQDTRFKAIEKKDGEADARFSVKVDLGENGQPWTYTGLMHLKQVGGKWKVVWDPSIINPKLKPGQRLAVQTQIPKRGLIQDSSGRPLLSPVQAVNVGVYPGQLADPERTLEQLAGATRKIDGGRRLDAERLLGRVRSAPPQQFLALLTLQRPQHNALIQQLNTQVPGLHFQPVTAQIAPKMAPELIGSLGPATADRLQQVGAPYQPGDTIGVSGLQLLQQRRLAGTPTVKVVAQDPSGKTVEELRTWQGTPAQDLKTTLDPGIQSLAQKALSRVTAPASLVAVSIATGGVTAAANTGTNGRNLAFEGRYPPGMTLGIVSAEALMAHAGMNESTPTTCPGTTTVGGQTFTNTARPKGPFQNNFAYSCATTIAQLSSKLDARTFLAEASKLGIGKDWGLPVPAFTGSLPPPANDGEKAAMMVGQGKAQVSPLAMALVAAAAQNGTWRPPYISPDMQSPTGAPQPETLDAQPLASLKTLLRRPVLAGVANEANPPRGKVYGMAAWPTYQENGGTKTVSWFVGSNGGDVAFAIAVEGKVSASKIAYAFLNGGSPKTSAR